MATVLEKVSEFKNEPVLTFADAQSQTKMEAAIARERASFGKEYDLVIGGECVKSPKQFESRNPSHPAEVVGRAQAATPEQARQAVLAAERAFVKWAKTPPLDRATLLLSAAQAVRARRFEFDALLVLEVGKSWVEADADVAEGIDFLEYYAREMIRYAGSQPVTPIPGEQNEMRYIPLGAGVVIPPWNFAFAITVGMTSAAIVAGNTVVLKPSSDAPVTAARFVDLLDDCGLPPGVLNFITGPGAEVGDVLVTHPRVRFVAFTGSKQVGLRINELAAKPQPGQIWIKRVIAEMGGKDSIVVAGDADIDSAVEGVTASAFGYQGQKCSACSRAIVEEPVYDAFVSKLAERAKKLSVGDAADRGSYMGPVINEGALRKIQRYVETGTKEGKLIAGGRRAAGDGYFVEPTVIVDVGPNATIAQEEIFGPVLAVIKAKDYDDALSIANNTEFGLTGSVYSRDPKKLERAREEFHVGNLYFNRKCTGAMVGAHPFGGFNMSGTDSKAGGPDYLLLFMQGKSISEKVR